MNLQPALTRDPASYMWELAVTTAAKQKFCFSPECEAGLKEQFKSGLEVYKIGLYEFRERIKEAETNIEKLVQVIIGEEIARDPASQLLHESSMFAALYARKLCPGLWHSASFVKSFRLLNDPSLRLFDEPDEHLHVFSTVGLRPQFFQGLRSVELRCQQDFVGVVDFANTFLAETPALESDRIQAVSLNIARGGGFGKGKNIAGNSRSAANKRVCANANKMVYRT